MCRYIHAITETSCERRHYVQAMGNWAKKLNGLTTRQQNSVILSLFDENPSGNGALTSHVCTVMRKAFPNGDSLMCSFIYQYCRELMNEDFNRNFKAMATRIPNPDFVIWSDLCMEFKYPKICISVRVVYSQMRAWLSKYFSQFSVGCKLHIYVLKVGTLMAD